MAVKINTPLRSAVSACRGNLFSVMFFSLFINVLMLVAPLYMLQVYDRVLLSKSYVTLIALTVVAIGCLVVYGLLEMVRSRVLVRTGLKFDEYLHQKVFKATFRASIGSTRDTSAQSLRDADTVREFISGGSIIAFCDAPWVPLFIFAGFILHPAMGWISLAGAIIIFILALLNELTTRNLLRDASTTQLGATNYTALSLRNAELVHGLGMISSVMNRWAGRHGLSLSKQKKASDRAGAILASSRFIRLSLQVGILGVGAYYVVEGELTPGSMIAGSILMGRALAPVEMAVGQWKMFVGSRNAYRRLEELFTRQPEVEKPMPLPAPTGAVSIENIVVVPPGGNFPVLRNVSLNLENGKAVGLIGPSGSGKSSLARALVGVWPVRVGKVCYDGAEIDQWDPEQLGPYLGYMPQDVELFAGSVAENISRFQNIDAEAVVEAATKAGVHEMVLDLPKGYNTQLGEGGYALSGGQRQRIALARALYGNPKVLILDEPNANLDSEGEQALARAIHQAKEEGKAVLVISHRSSLLAVVDLIAVLKDGLLVKFGPRDEVLAELGAAQAQLASSGKTDQ